MRIEVNYAKRQKAEAKKYTNRGMVRVPSAYEKSHVMIQISVCGVVSALADTVVSNIVSKLGLTDDCRLSRNTISGNGGQYDDVEMVYTEWLCIEKDTATAGNSKEYNDGVRSAVRRAAKAVKAETKASLVDSTGVFIQTYLAL